MKNWTKILLVSSLAVTGLFFVSCEGGGIECFDEIDNDGDGLIDDKDPACQYWVERAEQYTRNCNSTRSQIGVSNPACSLATNGVTEGDDPQCADRIDNDGDGMIDYGIQLYIGSTVNYKNSGDFGCENITDDDEANPACSDEVDNDGDGLVDGADYGCWVYSVYSFYYITYPEYGPAYDPRGASEALGPACADGLDNDGDGKIDYPSDPGCTGFLDRDNSEVDVECNDGKDNDGDGATDFPADLDCPNATANRERGLQCGNNFDDDGDGATDFPNDVGCANRFDDNELEPACSDGLDNDGDGEVDHPADPGCLTAGDNSEADTSACSDGIDNDLDGHRDFPDDPGCSGPDDNSETDGECEDGIDNDLDGLIDWVDPPCQLSLTFSESDTWQCSDGVDNDGDGSIDYPTDPECGSFNDEEGEGQCADGIDNDGDGFIDVTDTSTTSPNFGDPACDISTARDEDQDPPCFDKLDNDGDGRADAGGVDYDFDGLFDGPGEMPPDPGCLGPTGYSESPEPQCSDGIDNDGDGTADWAGIEIDGDGLFTGTGEMPPDYACTAGNPSPLAGQRRRDEANPTQCVDGIDNDQDGKIDFEPEFLPTSSTEAEPNPNYPNGDVQCVNIFDNAEAS